MEALHAAHDKLARADADAAYWMERFKQATEAVSQWVVQASEEENDQAPRYRLLQQALQDTRNGLDYAERAAARAQQELSDSRQFLLSMKTSTSEAESTAPRAAEAQEPPSIPVVESGAPFRIRTRAPSPSAAASEPHAPTVSSSPSSMRLSPMKRPSGETLYLVPAKRAKYPKHFEWEDRTKHHFPKDFTIPICALASMWTYWLCGDASAKYPPFRILTAPQLEDAKAKRTLSSLRFVMLEIESRVLDQGAWVNYPTAKDAADMLAAVRDSIAVRPTAKRGARHPVEQLQWTSLGRIFRDQRKLRGQGEGDDDDE
jgi:hypothetical protein